MKENTKEPQQVRGGDRAHAEGGRRDTKSRRPRRRRKKREDIEKHDAGEVGKKAGRRARLEAEEERE